MTRSKVDERPDLRPGVRDHGESYSLIVEADPGDLFEGVESSHQFYPVYVRKGCISWDCSCNLNSLENVRIFFISDRNLILAFSGDETP